MYYSSGNYEAFARPEKPEGVDHKSAYLIGRAAWPRCPPHALWCVTAR